METGTSEDRSAEKRRRILDAAWRVVLAHGPKGTTMEGLAREAGVAKATLYAQFSDKDAVIAAMVDAMLELLGRALSEGLAGDAPVAERIGAALAGKYRGILQAVEGSPHASEILNEGYRFAPRLEQFDHAVQADLTGHLARAGVANPAWLARVTIAAAAGIAEAGFTADEVDAAIRLVCRRVIGGRG